MQLYGFKVFSTKYKYLFKQTYLIHKETETCFGFICLMAYQSSWVIL